MTSENILLLLLMIRGMETQGWAGLTAQCCSLCCIPLAAGFSLLRIVTYHTTPFQPAGTYRLFPGWVLLRFGIVSHLASASVCLSTLHFTRAM